MFFAVPGRNPAWASPPKGEAGPGSAVLVAAGFLWAGADRGRLLPTSRSGRCMRRDIVGGRSLRGAGCPVTRYLGWSFALPFAALAAPLLVTFAGQPMALVASRMGGLAPVVGPWRSLFAEECSDFFHQR